MEVIYKAIDGKMFDDKEECMNYEFKLSIMDNNLTMLDKNGIKIFNDKNDSFDDFCNKIERCWYINIRTKEDLDIVKKAYNYIGVLPPKDIGLFYYDEYSDEWLDFNENIKEAENEIKKLKNFKKKLESLEV